MNGPKEDPRRYEVGYCKPPQHSQFKPGNRANPRGAKKGAGSFKNAVEDELNSKITVQENGKKKTMSKQVALAKTYVARALKGDDKAFGKLIPFIVALDTANQIEKATEGLSDAEKLILQRNAKRLLEKLAADHNTNDRDEKVPDDE